MATQHPEHLTPSKLAQMAKDKRATVRMVVADYPGTPRVILQQLLTDPDIGVKLIAAKRLDQLESVLAKLSAHSKSTVRAIVSNHPKTPPAVLEKLAKDQSDTVRLGVAQNNPSDHVLGLLKKDRHPRIKKIVDSKRVFKTKPKSKPLIGLSEIQQTLQTDPSHSSLPVPSKSSQRAQKPKPESPRSIQGIEAEPSFTPRDNSLR